MSQAEDVLKRPNVQMDNHGRSLLNRAVRLHMAVNGFTGEEDPESSGATLKAILEEYLKYKSDQIAAAGEED